MEILKTYRKCGFIPFSLEIEEHENGKKLLKPPKGYNNFHNFDVDNLVKNYNGMAIRTGTILKDGFYLMALDIDDNKDDTNKLNGLKKWRELLIDNNFKNGELSINTPIQQTFNKGYHYLFKITSEQFEKI